MWIDNRTSEIKVYEKQPSDPWVKKMTWSARNNAWVLYEEEKSDLIKIGEMLGDPEQLQAAKDWEAGKLSYLEMRMRMG